jgi:hypothetical protein
MGILVPLEFQRDPAAIAVPAEELGDPGVIEVERVPAAAAEVGLGLQNEGKSFFPLVVA